VGTKVSVPTPVEPVEEEDNPIKSIGNSNTLGIPGRNKSDKDHAYNVWLFQAHGDLLPGSWVNPEKFKSYVKHHPPKLVFTPDGGWIANPKKRKGRAHGTARKNGSSKIIPIQRKREAR
jgi:prenyltransferase beta subunit